MAKKVKQISYALYPNANTGAERYLSAPNWRKDGIGKFTLDENLDQRDLKYIYDKGGVDVVYMIEG